MNAGLYARVSKEEQARGYSIDEQLVAMRQYAATHGWQVTEYIEPGHTASTDERPVWQQLLSDVQEGRIGCVLVHKLDRGFRDLEDQLRNIKQLTAAGVGFVSLAEAFDTSTPAGQLAQNIVGAFNQYFLDNMRQEVAKGKRGRARAGLSNASKLPHGYTRQDSRALVDQLAAASVVRLFELYASGQYSYQSVADTMNAEGHPASPYTRDGIWTWRSVAGALANRFYIGEVRYLDQWYPGLQKPIIDRQLWNDVQAIKGRRAGGRPPRHAKHVNLLQGLVSCWLCKSPLWAETRTPTRIYYTDSAAYRRVECPNTGQRIRGRILHSQIEKIIKSLTLPAEWRAMAIEQLNHQFAAQDVNAQRTRLEQRLARLVDLYEMGHVERGDYLGRRSTIQAELESLHPPQAPAIEKAGQYLENVAELWDSATLEQQQQIVRTLFERVFVDVSNKTIVSIQPFPEFRVLFRLDRTEEHNGQFYPDQAG